MDLSRLGPLLLASDIDGLEFDPYVLAATLAFLATAVGLGAALTALRVLSRGSVWSAIRAAHEHARQMGAAMAVPLPGGRHGDAVILAKGGMAAVLPGARDLAKLDKAALVKDKDGQTGIVLHAGGQTTCVAGLEPMARAWSRLQQDGVQVDLVFRDDEAQRVGNAVKGLHPNEQQMLQKWLVEKEVITDVIRGVNYEGTVKTAGSKGEASLVVTNLRVGLLARTVLVETMGNQTRTTTSFSFTTYLLPKATRCTFERHPSLTTAGWRVKLDLPKELEQEGAPTLLLGPDHAGIFLPLVLFRCPTVVVDRGAGFGRIISESLGAAIGCGILLGGAAAAVAGLYYGSHHTYHARYIWPALGCGLVLPGIFKMFALTESWLERNRGAATLDAQP